MLLKGLFLLSGHHQDEGPFLLSWLQSPHIPTAGRADAAGRIPRGLESTWIAMKRKEVLIHAST